MKKFYVCLILLWIFNLLDFISTIYLINKGICREYNPIMNYFLTNYGLIVNTIIKIGFGSIGAYIFYINKYDTTTRISLYACCFIYFVLMLWHIKFYLF